MPESQFSNTITIMSFSKMKISVNRKLDFEPKKKECCVCMEVLREDYFPEDNEKIYKSEFAYGNAHQECCAGKGACQNVCISCLVKMDWKVFETFNRDGDKMESFEMVARQCPVCRCPAVYKYEMFERLFEKAHFKNVVGMSMTKILFNIEASNQNVRERNNFLEHRIIELDERVAMSQRFATDTKAKHIMASIMLMGLLNDTPVKVSKITLFNHARLMMDIKSFSRFSEELKENSGDSRILWTMMGDRNFMRIVAEDSYLNHVFQQAIFSIQATSMRRSISALA